MINAPDGKLVLVVGAARVRRVAFSVFDRQPVLDELLLGPIETDSEDARVHNLVYALVELKRIVFEVERGRNLFADFA